MSEIWTIKAGIFQGVIIFPRINFRRQEDGTCLRISLEKLSQEFPVVITKPTDMVILKQKEMEMKQAKKDKRKGKQIIMVKQWAKHKQTQLVLPRQVLKHPHPHKVRKK